MRNGRHWSFVIGHLQRPTAGNGEQGRRKLPKWQAAANGRESGFGNRRPGFAARGSSLAATVDDVRQAR